MTTMSDKFVIKFESNELISLLAARYLMDDNKVEILNRKKNFTFNDSFLFEGKTFDCGYHAIDIGRSAIYNEILFSTGIKWMKTESTRALVFNGKKYKRGYAQLELSETFSNVDKNKFLDNFLSTLEKIYGSDFVSFAIENIADSYAQNRLWINQKQSYEKILTNIYPWFFPFKQEDAKGKLNHLKHHFHNDITQKNFVMYPRNSSFGAISDALRTVVENCIIQTDDSDYKFAVLDNNGKINVDNNTYHVVPIDYYNIASRFNFEYPSHTKTYFYLVSVVFDQPIEFSEHEILVGDRDYFIDRVSTPDTLAGRRLITSLQFECETLVKIDEHKLLQNIRSFTKKFITDKSINKYDIKKVMLKRYKPQMVDDIANKIVDFVETQNPTVVVLNRHIDIRNISESLDILLQKIKRMGDL